MQCSRVISKYSLKCTHSRTYEFQKPPNRAIKRELPYFNYTNQIVRSILPATVNYLATSLSLLRPTIRPPKNTASTRIDGERGS